MTLVAEVLAPEPVGRLPLADHVPHYGLDFEHERERQAAAARAIERLVAAGGDQHAEAGPDRICRQRS